MELLIKPEKFRIAEKREENDYNYTKYELYPLEKGYAVTIGNALRRVLLSSIPSLAITGLRIPGKLHEYDTVEGIEEDILEISLNLKKVQLKVESLDKLKNIDHPILLTLKKKYKAKDVIKAGDIKTPAGIEVANSDLIIAHVNKDMEVDFELYAQTGKGFVPAQELSYQSDIEYIFIDGVFSPVLKVNYLTENIRVGRRTDYDKLILEIWTKKNITPSEALKEATETLMEHFDFIAQLWNREGKIQDLESAEVTIEIENEEQEETEDTDVSNITNQSNEDTERMYSNLQNYFEQYEEFIAVYVGTKNGDMFMRPVESEKQLPEDFDPRTRPWYKDAVAKPNEVIITDPYIDVVTKDTLVTVSKAVKSSKGEIVGAVGIDLSMAKISEMLKKDLGFKETLFVINNKGIIIFHPDSKRIGLDISNESFFKNLKGQSNVSYVKDGTVFYTCTKLSGIDWTLITEVNIKNLFGEVRSITNVNLVIVIIVAVLAILLGIFFTNRFITKPINQLKTHITEIATGDLTQKVEISSKDEIGEMAEALNGAIESWANSIVSIREGAINIDGSASEIMNISGPFEVIAIVCSK
jgi:DNA-directed RNA polymerase subunit alpha